VKHCRWCSRDLDESDFHRDRTEPSGRRTKCKDCSRRPKPKPCERRSKLGTSEMKDFLAELQETRAIVFKTEGPDCVAIGLGVAIYRLKSRLGLLRSENRCSRRASRQGSA